MAIEFHCPFCGKPIRAPDSAGGKHGQCPSCHQTVYVPTADITDDEILSVEPLDMKAERERLAAEKKARELQRRVLHEREAPPERAGDVDARRRAAGAALGGGAARPAAAAGPMIRPKADLERMIKEYVLAMAGGKLDRAERLAAEIHANMALAEEIIQRLTVDEIPPQELAHIPRPVLIGFFKQLRQAR